VTPCGTLVDLYFGEFAALSFYFILINAYDMISREHDYDGE